MVPESKHLIPAWWALSGLKRALPWLGDSLSRSAIWCTKRLRVQFLVRDTQAEDLTPWMGCAHKAACRCFSLTLKFLSFFLCLSFPRSLKSINRSLGEDNKTKKKKDHEKGLAHYSSTAPSFYRRDADIERQQVP